MKKRRSKFVTVTIQGTHFTGDAFTARLAKAIFEPITPANALLHLHQRCGCGMGKFGHSCVPGDVCRHKGGCHGLHVALDDLILTIRRRST